MILEAGSGHVGGSLSAADIMVVLYWQVLRMKPDRPTWEDRDRFVLSKAHAAPALYAALARRGYFDVRDLLTFRKLKSKLQGSPDAQRTAGRGRLGRLAGGGPLDRERHRAGGEARGQGLPRVLPSRRRRGPGGPGLGGRAHGRCGTSSTTSARSST